MISGWMNRLLDECIGSGWIHRKINEWIDGWWINEYMSGMVSR